MLMAPGMYVTVIKREIKEGAKNLARIVFFLYRHIETCPGLRLWIQRLVTART
jgi:hypothetical protein